MFGVIQWVQKCIAHCRPHHGVPKIRHIPAEMICGDDDFLILDVIDYGAEVRMGN